MTSTHLKISYSVPKQRYNILLRLLFLCSNTIYLSTNQQGAELPIVPILKLIATMFNPLVLWQAPEVNPVNRKARSIPGLNPINIYGRVFTFSWFGFMIAFWSWYVEP